jgi:RNA polymerase sigma factor (sigma-70 family)
MEAEEDRDLQAEYGGMITSIARKFPIKSSRYEFDDLFAEGMKAAVIAVRNRPTDTLYKESTWVYNAIHMAILSFVRKNTYDLSVSEHTQRKAHLEGVKDVLNSTAKAIRADHLHVGNNEDAANNFFDVIASGEPPEDRMIHNESLEILREEINALPEREQNILTAFYIDGAKLRDIAEHEGVTTQRVAQIKERAFAKLKTKMEKRYADALV